MTVDAQTLLRRAIDLHRQGRLAEAGTVYREALAAQPDNADALHLLGVIARAQGDAVAAVALISRSVTAAPWFAEAHYNLGNALADQGLMEDAAGAYRKALDLKPNFAEAMGALAKLAGRRPLDRQADLLDRQYHEGAWDYLSGVGEAARYGVVAAYVRRAPPGGGVLDLGCGAGTLFPYLPDALAGGYLGVDISRHALENFRRDRPAARLACAPVEEFAPSPEERFAAIVFNEVLVYAGDPVAQVDRCRRWLVPGGVVVVSWYRMADPAQVRREEAFWLALDRPDWPLVDHSVLTNGHQGLTWRIRLYRPAPP